MRICRRENATDEDDGYLLVHVRDENRGRSYVDVLDARTLAQKPITRIQIQNRVPYPFHAGWMPAMMGCHWRVKAPQNHPECFASPTPP